MTLLPYSLFRSALPAMVLAALPAQAIANESGACLTEAEAHSLVLYALPDAVTQLGDSCAASLPSTAYLVASRQALSARFEKAALPAAPAARIAFLKLSGLSEKQFAKLGDKTFRDVFSMGIATAMGKGVKPSDCRIINDVLEPLDPLPPENIAALIGVALREGGPKEKAGGSKSPFRICGTEEGK